MGGSRKGAQAHLPLWRCDVPSLHATDHTLFGGGLCVRRCQEFLVERVFHLRTLLVNILLLSSFSALWSRSVSMQSPRAFLIVLIEFSRTLFGSQINPLLLASSSPSSCAYFLYRTDKSFGGLRQVPPHELAAVCAYFLRGVHSSQACF